MVSRDLFKTINVGSAIKICGEWVQSNGPNQPMELIASKCTLIGYNETPVNFIKKIFNAIFFKI